MIFGPVESGSDTEGHSALLLLTPEFSGNFMEQYNMAKNLMNVDTESASLESWAINDCDRGEVDWSRGSVDSVRIQTQEGEVESYDITEDQQAALRLICAEALADSSVHPWLQFDIGFLLGNAAIKIIGASAGDKLSAIKRFAKAS